MNIGGCRYLLLVLLLVCAGCANITAPTGGKRDATPPKLIKIAPSDSLLNTKVSRIYIDFDEYIVVSDATKEVELSPMLPIAPVVTGNNRRVTVKIVDSLLEPNTTYRLSFGNAIKDLHESNPFSKYTYTFSTGAYFDSLQLLGQIINAATGLPDSSGAWVELYSGAEADSAVVRHKPKYITKADGKGVFTFKGLPKRDFKIYALKDANINMVYDGNGEQIAFNNTIVTPGDSTANRIVLKIFEEIADTAAKRKTDSLQKAKALRMGKEPKGEEAFSYVINVDSSDVSKRTFDLTNDIKIIFNKIPVLARQKITLSYDSAGVTYTPECRYKTDSAHPNQLYVIPPHWAEDRVYTLKLAKGFAKDTTGKEIMPARFSFRTWGDEEYGKLKLHLPTKYYDRKYVLLINSDKDTVANAPVTDTMIKLVHLRPARYTIRLIVDANGNGKWDTGDLFAKRQPEEVVPYNEPVNVKAGWDMVIDFDTKPTTGKKGDKGGVR